MLSAIVGRIKNVREALHGRREAAAARRAAATVPRSAGADDVVEFLFSGAAPGIEPWQVPEEFRSLARIVEQRRPMTVVEIGTADGGTLFAHARLAHPDALIISIDLPYGLFGAGYPAWRIPLYRSFAGPGQRLELLRVDSHAPATAALLERLLDGRRIDYAFIDGDHTYDGVRQDFELCLRFAATDAVIAFHDIAQKPNPEYVPPPGMEHAAWAVHTFWEEVRRRYAHEELIRDRDQEGYGIGVLYLDRP
jgi:predicted O-methyltransferase YrrM